MSSSKATLRTDLLATRRLLSAAQRQLASKKACEQLSFASELVVATYMATDEELSLAALDHPRLVVPAFVDGAYQFVKKRDPMIMGPYGILQPEALVIVDHVDIILVPCVGVDRHGNRLGYGKGIYDRLLVAYPDAQKIGAVFDCQLCEQIDSESHDIQLDRVVITSHTVP